MEDTKQLLEIVKQNIEQLLSHIEKDNSYDSSRYVIKIMGWIRDLTEKVIKLEASKSNE